MTGAPWLYITPPMGFKSDDESRHDSNFLKNALDAEPAQGSYILKLAAVLLIGVCGLTLGILGFYGWNHFQSDNPAVFEFVKVRLETIRDACTRAENANQALSDHKREYSVAFEQGLSAMVLNDYAHAVADAQSTLERKRVEVNSLQHNLTEAWMKDHRSYSNAMRRLRAEADARGQGRLAELADDFLKYFAIVTANGGQQVDDDSFTSALMQRNSQVLAEPKTSKSQRSQ